MTTGIKTQTWEEIVHEVATHHTLNPIEVFGRMCLESPEVASFISALGRDAMFAGSLVYEAMQRQVRKDALAALERTR